MTIDSKHIDSAHQSFQILDSLPIAVTVTDVSGRIIYFNKRSAQILDRKPEYLGRNIRLCHQIPESINKIDNILQNFKDGSRQEATYDTLRNGKNLTVIFTPLIDDGELLGCIQTVIIKD